MFAETTTIDPLQLLLVNAGVAGVVVVLLLMGWLWAKPAVTREFEKADQRDQQQKALIDTMLAVYHSEVLPTLADVDKRMIPLMEKVSGHLQRVEERMLKMDEEWRRREVVARAEEEAAKRYGRPGSGQGDYGRGVGQGPGSVGDPSHPERSS